MQFHFEPAFTRDRLGIEVVKQYDLVKIQPTEFVAKYLCCNVSIALEIKVKFLYICGHLSDFLFKFYLKLYHWDFKIKSPQKKTTSFPIKILYLDLSNLTPNPYEYNLNASIFACD